VWGYLKGPKADMGHLFNHLVDSIQEAKWWSETGCLGSLEVDNEIEFGLAAKLEDWQTF